MHLIHQMASPGPTVPYIPASPAGLPGAHTLQTLAGGLEWWALIAAVVGLIVGAVMWAFGSYSNNYQQSVAGRRGVLVSALAALLIGGAPSIINFFLGMGIR